MRLPVVLITASLLAGGASCSEKAPPKDDAVALADAAPQRSAKRGAAAQGAADSAPSIPKGAQWTILCREFTGKDHVPVARQWKDAMVKSSGMRDWHLLHRDDSSLLYYGYYKSYTDSRAKADWKKIDGMTIEGRRPFARSIITPLEAADPAGPPEWDLANAKGYWSLQIAVYKDSPERKQYAVDAVRAARAQGIEAYYFHTDTMSHVCVGTWPQEAVRVADDTVRAGDQGQIKVVLPPLTPDVKRAPEIRGEGGRRMHVEAPRNEVLDPTLRDMMENKFPTMAVNGATMITRRKDPRTGQVQEVADASFPVKIPRRDASLLDGDGGGIPIPPAEGAFINTAPPGAGTGGGVRRSTNGS